MPVNKKIENIEYLPYGELFFERRDYWNTPYKFNAKELDAETGMYYYGARYYTPEVSIWLSVDPLAGEYPSLSPYNYCANSPVMYVDPDGMRIRLGLFTRLFRRSAYKAFKEIIETDAGKEVFAPYMTKRQARKYLGDNASAGKYAKNVSIVLRGQYKEFQLDEEKDGEFFAKIKNRFGVKCDISDLPNKNKSTTNLDKTFKVKLVVILYNTESRSHGENIQLTAHEIGLHLYPYLRLIEEVLYNNNNYSYTQKIDQITERWEGSTSENNPNTSLDGSTHHYFHEEGNSSFLYMRLSSEMKNKLKGNDLQEFIKAEKNDRSKF